MAHEVLAQELWTWILTYSQVKRCGLGPRQSGDLEPKIPYKASTLQRLYPEGKDRGDTFSLHRRTRKHTHLYLSFQWGKTTKDLENYEPWAYTLYVCVPAKALQSCLILCDSMDCSLPGSLVYAILQARILEWVAMSTPPPGDLPDPGIEPSSLMSPALAGEFFTTSTTWVALCIDLV